MKTLIIGLDAFDPALFENLYERGKLQNLGNLVRKGGYARFRVSNPPQSEVSWTSIATGLNPGEHGMFDFVHRDPATYALNVSLLPTGRSLGGIQFLRPYNARTIFDVTAERGFPSTSLWWPATFPARPESPVQTLPGLGTPDIQGRLGVGCFFSSNLDLPEKRGKTPVVHLKNSTMDRFFANFFGPLINTKTGPSNAVIPFELLVKDDSAAEIKIGKQVIKLQLGEWSPIIEFQFKVSLLASVQAISRIILTQVQPYVQFYLLPLQIHPLHPLWRYGTPASFVRHAWQTSGPFLTLGWPQDTTGLEDGCIGDDQFLSLCDSIFNARAHLLNHLLKTFKEGLLASVFDSLDRVQHMFWQSRPDVLETWYTRLDQLVGQAISQLAENPDEKSRLLVVSDHGFNNFDYKVQLNRWLAMKGYLVTKQEAPEGDLKDVDWSRTQVYAIGLNSLYFNISGREGQGCVPPDYTNSLSDRLCRDLTTWLGPDHQSVVQKAYPKTEVFKGAFAAGGPDILVGYTPGYRASAETGLGAWKNEPIEFNNDHWHSDHCFDGESVPGVLFYNGDLKNFSMPSYRDFPSMAIDATPDARGATPPPTMSAEDQENVEERLKSLGYL
jgi:predicted AlkP superfamily phosphohydrolase/phosphomutase